MIQSTQVDIRCLPILDLVEAARAGNRLALARVLTLVENDTPDGRLALNLLFPYTGNAHRIGLTGSPGTGKSSLVNQIAKAYRRNDPQGQLRIAIVAVDPSSPFSGGAVLGDRVRMRDLAGDPGIFIRSMATRGTLGGLARATAAVTQVFDAVGFDKVLIETVGAGQSEVDIASLAHTTLVIEAPGLGDDIQAIKAGILEIADILVVNKADRPGADAAERILCSMLDMSHPVESQVYHPRCSEPDDAFALDPEQLPFASPNQPEMKQWVPPIVRTVASSGIGTDGLVQAIENHRAFLRGSGEWQRRDAGRLQIELQELVQAFLVTRWRENVPDQAFFEVFSRLMERRISPNQAAEILIDAHPDCTDRSK